MKPDGKVANLKMWEGIEIGNMRIRRVFGGLIVTEIKIFAYEIGISATVPSETGISSVFVKVPNAFFKHKTDE